MIRKNYEHCCCPIRFGSYAVNPPSSATRGRHLPGELGIWVFILGDMVLFGLFFGTFMFYRADSPELYARSQETLSYNFGAMNTLLLLASSWFVAMAVQHGKNQRVALVPLRLAAAFVCGLAFAVLKVVEYGEKIHAGITPATNDFFMFYFVLTGVHFFHLLIGMSVLAYLWNRCRQTPWIPQNLVVLESGASFWHLIDLLWIVLFALLYLAR